MLSQDELWPLIKGAPLPTKTGPLPNRLEYLDTAPARDATRYLITLLLDTIAS